MADRVVAMREGAIEQIGTPTEIYRMPRNRYVAQFLGEPTINLLGCTIEQRSGELVLCALPNGPLPLRQGITFKGAIILGIRPHHAVVDHQASPESGAAKVADIENLGSEHVLHLDYGGQHLATMTAPGYASVGEIVHVTFDLSHAHLIDPASGDVVASAL